MRVVKRGPMAGMDRLRDHLVREYRKKTAKSRAVFHRAEKVMIEGGSHTIRLWRPYPFFASGAEARVRKLGGREAKVRFTTSGTLATMYTVMLSQGLTGRDLVLKIGGGWHGASPDPLKGVKDHGGEGFGGGGAG